MSIRYLDLPIHYTREEYYAFLEHTAPRILRGMQRAPPLGKLRVIIAELAQYGVEDKLLRLNELNLFDDGNLEDTTYCRLGPDITSAYVLWLLDPRDLLLMIHEHPAIVEWRLEINR